MNNSLLERLSALVVIPNKQPRAIAKDVFINWISTFESPNKFLIDSDGESSNSTFTCISLAIIIKTTAVKIPWNEGLVEKDTM